MRMALMFCAALMTPLLLAGDEAKGMKPGDPMKPFDVVDFTGKFKELPQVCYV